MHIWMTTLLLFASSPSLASLQCLQSGRIHQFETKSAVELKTEYDSLKNKKGLRAKRLFARLKDQSLAETNAAFEALATQYGFRWTNKLKREDSSTEAWSKIREFSGELELAIHREVASSLVGYLNGFRFFNNAKESRNARAISRRQDLEPLREQMRLYLETVFLPKLIKKRKKVAILLEGIDSAGKGVTIDFLYGLLHKLVEKKGSLFEGQVKITIIKLGKPEPNMSTEAFVRRWTDLVVPTVPREREARARVSEKGEPIAEIFIFDRGPIHNRLVSEPAWGWTDPALVKEFRENVGMMKNILNEKGVHLVEIMSNISPFQAASNILNRYSREAGQHLSSPVDLQLFRRLKAYVKYQRGALSLIANKAGGMVAVYANGADGHHRGRDSKVSRLSATSQAIQMGLGRLPFMQGRKSREWMKNHDFDLALLIERGNIFVNWIWGWHRPSFGNNVLPSKAVLERTNKTLETVKGKVDLLKGAVLEVNPIYEIRTWLSLKQPVPPELIQRYLSSEANRPIEPLIQAYESWGVPIPKEIFEANAG